MILQFQASLKLDKYIQQKSVCVCVCVCVFAPVDIINEYLYPHYVL